MQHEGEEGRRGGEARLAPEALDVGVAADEDDVAGEELDADGVVRGRCCMMLACGWAAEGGQRTRLL